MIMGGLSADEFFANQGVENIIAGVKTLETYIAHGSKNSELLRTWIEERKDWLRRVGAAW